jgi:hypothetical protein
MGGHQSAGEKKWANPRAWRPSRRSLSPVQSGASNSSASATCGVSASSTSRQRRCALRQCSGAMRSSLKRWRFRSRTWYSLARSSSVKRLRRRIFSLCLKSSTRTLSQTWNRCSARSKASANLLSSRRSAEKTMFVRQQLHSHPRPRVTPEHATGCEPIRRGRSRLRAGPHPLRSAHCGGGWIPVRENPESARLRCVLGHPPRLSLTTISCSSTSIRYAGSAMRLSSGSGL